MCCETWRSWGAFVLCVLFGLCLSGAAVVAQKQVTRQESREVEPHTVRSCYIPQAIPWSCSALNGHVAHTLACFELHIPPLLSSIKGPNTEQNKCLTGKVSVERLALLRTSFCTTTHSRTHSVTQSLTHSLTHTLTHTLTQSLSHSLSHSLNSLPPSLTH